MKKKSLAFTALLTLVTSISGCSPTTAPTGFQGIAYPDDSQIAKALDSQLASDPNSAAARELIHTLGGADGKLRYQIKQVIYRQGVFEVHYDAALQMGQTGAQSLQSLYTQMVPEDERKKLAEPTREALEKWLTTHAETLKKDPAQQAQGQALSNTIAMLNKCYGDTKPGSEVVVLQGLGAALLPERSGLYAEKLAMPATTAQCLPA